MALLSAADQQKLREVFEHMTRPVRLLFFSQAIGCETCGETRQILDELSGLSEKISVEELNPVLDGDKAKEYGVDRVPAIAIVYGGSGGSGGADASSGSGGADASSGSGGADASSDGQSSNAMIDSRIRFLGAPSGYEFVSLVQAVLLAGGRESALSPASRDRLRAVDRPITMQVFTTPT